MSAVSVTIGADTTQFDAAVKGLPEKVNRAGASMSRAGGGGGFRNLGLMSQQFQDIAIQAQMGTKWTTIIAQQGSQMLSVFGPGGMIAGGVVAIGGAFMTMSDNATKAFNDAKNAAADFNVELDKILAVGSFDQVGDSLTKISREMRSISEQQADLLAPAGGMGIVDLFKDAWANTKDFFGVGPSIADNQAAMNERRAELLTKETEATQRLLSLSSNQTDIAEMRARGEKDAADQMERQIKLGQELARIEGMSLTRGQKAQLINDANRRFVAQSPQQGGSNILSRTMDLFSSKFQMAAGPVMQAVKQQLTEQAGKLTGNAKALGQAAFSPLRGDMDISTGRGSSINSLRSSASSQIQQMMKQSALLKMQADKIDRSNSLLGDIAESVKKFNPQLSYN